MTYTVQSWTAQGKPVFHEVVAKTPAEAMEIAAVERWPGTSTFTSPDRQVGIGGKLEWMADRCQVTRNGDPVGRVAVYALR